MKLKPNADFTLYTDLNTGNVYSTARGIERLTGYDNTNITRGAFKGAVIIHSKRVETLTAGGIQGAVIYDEDFIEMVLDYQDDKNHPVARATNKTLRRIGLKTFIQHETGYHQASESVVSLFDHLRNTHRIVHKDWNERMVNEGHESWEIAALYKVLFNSAVGAPDAWDFYKRLAGGQPSLSVVSEKHLDMICKSLINS